jgi:hypothetical protein
MGTRCPQKQLLAKQASGTARRDLRCGLRMFGSSLLESEMMS